MSALEVHEDVVSMKSVSEAVDSVQILYTILKNDTEGIKISNKVSILNAYNITYTYCSKLPLLRITVFCFHLGQHRTTLTWKRTSMKKQ